MNTLAVPMEPAIAQRKHHSLEGVLIGTAVGDSIGLPMEGLSARRQQKLFPPPLRQRLVGSLGMISDDTEHTVLVAQAVLQGPQNPAHFQKCLARGLRWWLASMPAGVGFATLRSILRLWLGFSPQRSGVMSAGNGPAMRSALLGVYFDDAEQRSAFVTASSEITHRDPRAIIAAIAVAETARWMIQERNDVEALTNLFASLSDRPDWGELIGKIRVRLMQNERVGSFAEAIGARDSVSGYAFHSVPVAIYAAIRHNDDFAAALTEVISCGGDTDTMGAITGALVGARVGVSGIPAPWRDRIADYPRSISLLLQLAERLSQQSSQPEALGVVRYPWFLLPFRNLAFLGVVLTHGLRRLLPPY